MPFLAWTSYGWMDVSLLLELEASAVQITIMVSKAKLAALGPSKLSQALAQLNAQPKLTLNATKTPRALDFLMLSEMTALVHGMTLQTWSASAMANVHFTDILPKTTYLESATQILR